MPTPHRASVSEIPGFAVRLLAADILDGVLRRMRPLDEVWETKLAGSALDERDRALTRQLVATVLRRLGSLRHVLSALLEKGFPKDTPRTEHALLLGAAQILFLDVADHAAVDLSVRLVQADRKAGRYAGLVNAVLRRVTREGKAILATTDATINTPDWLLARWSKTYGTDAARAIALANGNEAALDLTVKRDPDTWATTFSDISRSENDVQALHAARHQTLVMPTGQVRTIPHGPITAMPGFAEGEWWVQDAAAAIPARLLGDVRGRDVVELCAAPGGKSAQLAQAGARVTAIDRSVARTARLKENFTRLGLAVEAIAADATQWQGGPFDAVLLDAPCSATGTIRRHPDIPWLKQEADLVGLAALQARLLDHAVTLLRPDGTLVYCVCSLEPEEGEAVIAALLDRNPALRREPIAPGEIGGIEEFITPLGDLRTLPSAWPADDPRLSGLDGFYAARLRHR